MKTQQVQTGAFFADNFQQVKPNQPCGKLSVNKLWSILSAALYVKLSIYCAQGSI